MAASPGPPIRSGDTTSLSARGRLTLDTALFIAIVIASQPSWTGLSLHEWLAGLLVVPALYHLVINWDWVVRMAPRLIAKIRATSRLNFAVDVTLFLATVTVMISGIMVLPGIVSTSDGTVVLSVWQHAHKISSNLTLAAMVAHFALHAKWMSGVAMRWLIPAPGRHSVGRARALARSTKARS